MKEELVKHRGRYICTENWKIKKKPKMCNSLVQTYENTLRKAETSDLSKYCGKI